MNNCPKCNSSNIEEDDNNDFIMGIAIGIPVALGVVPHEFKCRKCGYEWSN